MNTQEIFALLSRWFHILPAILLVGGTLFMRLSLVPAALESEVTPEYRESVRRRWAKLVALSVLFLLVSGLYNSYLKAMGFKLGGLYNGLLLVKIVLAFVIFYLASVLSGRSKTAQKFREREAHWLNILCVLMLSVVLIAGYMKMSSASAPKKIRDENGKVISLDPPVETSGVEANATE